MVQKISKLKRQKKTVGLKSKGVRISILAISMIGLAGALYFALGYFNPKKVQDYQIHGFDVSRHQGDIDWKKIDTQKYQFVFIKATEGGDYQDPKFSQNWLSAHEQSLKVGAYHYFRNCRTGAEQAQNYIQTVPIQSHSLPPVIDLEFQWNCPDLTAQQLQQQIVIMSKTLEQHYGKKPILYTTPNYYKTYVKGYFDDHVLWLQNIGKMPPRMDRRPWLFWQYSQTAKITGIDVAVDLNLFRGNAADLNSLIRPNASHQAAAHDHAHP